MRIIIVVLFALTGLYGQAQFSVSTGFSRINENIIGGNSPSFFDKSQLYSYNSYVFQGDYTKSFFRVYSELSYLPESFSNEKHYYTSGGGGYNSLYSNKVDYYSDLKFSYVAFKFGIGAQLKVNFNENWWANISGNFYGQYDRFIRSFESNQVMYRRTTYSGTVTNYPPNYTPQQLYSFNDNLFQFGLELKARIGFKNYFVEISSSLSMVNDDRTQQLILVDENSFQYSSWILNAGLKVGYRFKQKKAKESKP